MILNLACIIEDLKKFFSEYLNIKFKYIDDNSLIIEELGADSLTIAQLFVHIEEKYKIILDKEYILQSFLSVRDVANKILFEVNKQ